jgi:hypothetical protein
MQNFDNLKAQAESLPETVRQNALALIEVMGTPVEGIGDNPTPWRPPYLRLVQGTTDRGSIPKGTGIGEFVLGEEKLERPFPFIPVRIWDSRQYWDPDQTSSKILCSSPDAKTGFMFGECRTCPYSQWVDGEGSACGKGKNIIAISSDLSRIFTVSFFKSNFKVGNELETLMKKAAVHTYARTYGLNSGTSTTAKNVENFKIEVLGDKERRTPEAHLPFLKELFNMTSADRKMNLDTFYENLAKKREQAALNGTTITAITHAPAPAEEKVVVSDATEIKTVAAPDKISPMAKSYSV